MFRHKSGQSPTNSAVDQYYSLAASFFLLFSNSTTLMILDVVRKKEMTCLAISKKLGIAPETVLSTLRSMEQEGILVSHVRSRNTFYGISDPNVLSAFDQILKLPAKKLNRTGSPKKELQANRKKGNKSSETDSVAFVR
ncbi:MAG: winged helix-turn-helix domain-containing protein [Acidobacteriota bacterium]